MSTPRTPAAFAHSRGYLDTASYGLPSWETARALRRAAGTWETGAFAPEQADAAVERLRAAFGALVGVPSTSVALAGSTSQVVGMVAASLPEGARVLVADGDFGSLVRPFLADPRLRVRSLPLEALVDAITPAVDLVAVSAVQSRDGRLIDLEALHEASRRAGARTVVDATQATPWLPVDAERFDVVVVSAYKWLNAPRGLALAAIHPDATWLRPVYASWYGSDSPWENLYAPLGLSHGARRFDSSPPWQLCEAGALALEFHARQDSRQVHDHCVGLADAFCEEVGLAPTGSAIVTLAAEADRLRAAGVRASERAGRVRLSFHVYNDEVDVQRAATALRPVVAAA
ncbi:aminotransferase class V-fold PLP-dependent enzyme [Demequina globuliformis]|uniref:aminotransferase class V-fold PLP-dependent enzyme n=1 Tax=Demequina globuliformis TaxID=676202 RepID=UPI0007846248|nr:aminotransferase class V-fold PLP-dependent enzyme [Demequina globuliformis]